MRCERKAAEATLPCFLLPYTLMRWSELQQSSYGHEEKAKRMAEMLLQAFKKKPAAATCLWAFYDVIQNPISIKKKNPISISYS